MLKRVVIKITGRVQGVGFRPFVFRLASKHGIKGFVCNDSSGVTIDAESLQKNLDTFIKAININPPPLSIIDSVSIHSGNPVNYKNFEIIESIREDTAIIETAGLKLNISPDIATCEKCREELADTKNRRYLYPFINCTDCGPRFTIITKLPYDRISTTMREFEMCPACNREYHDPLNRRFHAEPNSCFLCGPSVKFLYNEKIKNDLTGNEYNKEDIKLAVKLIKDGGIVAVKGIGGFHLMCDASNDNAVKLLRKRKDRPSKPFAVMFKDMGSLSEYANLKKVNPSGKSGFVNNFPEKALADILTGNERPIVLIKDKGKLSYHVNCGLKNIGVFLPYSPLHHIIFKFFEKPLVATSANRNGEPIAKDNVEALSKLKNIADGFLMNNRDIYRGCDDSVVKPFSYNEFIFIRRARGYTPDPLKVKLKFKRNVFSTGSFLKNTFSFAFSAKNSVGQTNSRVILSQHMGDLDTVSGMENFTKNFKELAELYNFKPELIIYDLHPDYENTKWAKAESSRTGIKCIPLQHHKAHIISCMAENWIPVKSKVMGAAFDGSGLGEDGKIWGGEFFKGTYIKLERIGTFKPFKLLGGEKAVKSPKRILISILFELFKEKRWGCNPENNFDKEIGCKYISELTGTGENEISMFFKLWEKEINSPYTSSCGRLFDAVSCLCGYKNDISYEGEAAVYVENLCADYLDKGNGMDNTEHFDYKIDFDPNEKIYIVDYLPAINQIIKIIFEDAAKGIESRNKVNYLIAARFIKTLSRIILDMAEISGCKDICMSGGVFQNSILLESALKTLKENGFNGLINKKVPPNDGGISFGQAVFGGLVKI